MVMRGDVWLATLDPTVGSEIRKTRPCLVISPAEVHDYLRTLVIAPMTSKSRPAAYRVPVTFQGVDGLILIEQSRVIDKRRLVKRLGSVTPEVLAAVLAVLREFYTD